MKVIRGTGEEVSKRVNVTLADKIYNELVEEAEAQGRTPANLAAFLLEKSLLELKEKGKKR
jgi:hypothetical protein